MKIERHLLADDGIVPNNPELPLVVYRQALVAGSPERIIAHFAARGWSNAWVNGIYDFHHYHATTHEVLGLSAGSARVQFGGASGPVVEVAAGDAVLIPAGVGHRRLSPAAGLVVVGAYPGGSDWDLVRASAATCAASRTRIARVPSPQADPIV